MTRTGIAYLGWQGYGNFGDDLLHDTWRAALGHPLDVETPLTARSYAKQAPQVLRDRLRMVGARRLVLLGGGTTIGFGTWAGHAHRAALAYGAEAVVGLGLGAAESGDTHLLSTQPYDWAAWQRVPRFRLAGVRGPLSQREVEQNLQPTDVIGDPALLYPDVRPVTPQGGSAIGVALGSDPTTRFDIDAVAAQVDRRARAEARPVRVFALSEADRPVAAAVAARLRVPHELHHYERDVHATMQAIASCTVLVSERLHGVIAAVALGVPTVPLAYASKCDDFWMSVTGTRPTTTVDASEEQIAAAIDDAALTATTEQAVTVLRTRLADVAERLRAWNDGAPLDLSAADSGAERAA